jgi:two-component system, NtrC family, response regulator HydG
MAVAGPRVMVVDDAADTVEVVRRNLNANGCQVLTASSVAQAVCLLDSHPVDVVITDLRMPKVGGLELVRHVRENTRDTEIIVITGYPTINGAVQAMKSGAEEYLPKPFTDEELFCAVEHAMAKLRARRAAHPRSERGSLLAQGIIGESAALRQVLEAVRKAATSNATVLLTGESGTGKELVARAIHYQSARGNAPFVPVNCGAVPEGLLESELFGHVKGAFTGATEARAGYFHAADSGTLFLDEIGEMSLAMQVKLLRVLQDREVWMVGSTRPRQLDVRIVAATNIDLPHLVKSRTFREDLFYRLNVVTITIPPLRERDDDVLLLARHFANRLAHELGKPVPRFSDDVLRVFRNHHWPGNVRELENVIQRLVVMVEADVVEIPDLPCIMRFATARDCRVDRRLVEVEMEHICNVLASVQGNKTRAAEILGIDRKTLRDKLKTLGLPVEERRQTGRISPVGDLVPAFRTSAERKSTLS